MILCRIEMVSSCAGADVVFHMRAAVKFVSRFSKRECRCKVVLQITDDVIV